MATGTVKWFSNDKGYGFITQDDDKSAEPTEPNAPGEPRTSLRTLRAPSALIASISVDNLAAKLARRVRSSASAERASDPSSRDESSRPCECRSSEESRLFPKSWLQGLVDGVTLVLLLVPV
jgi:'Cold-shock' DNA-binding domain